MLLIIITLKDSAGNPVPAWKIFWQTFGASNQLLAALALIAVTIWLFNTAKNRKAWLVSFIPAVIMVIMSSWTLIQMLLTAIVKERAFSFPADPNAIVPVSCIIYLALAAWMIIVTIQSMLKKNRPVKVGII
ncbi:MAG: hypothetical protein GX846_05485 [Deltaproteobacteria bacterium]|nr:hypothetical protein [Deltaproteobacteria bacterium]